MGASHEVMVDVVVLGVQEEEEEEEKEVVVSECEEEAWKRGRG